ncbi:phage tail protein [Brevibacillus humidisoli]|uniref:phage tail protein n=1 Tax=Brevibacillus humidisoli TaxID=2895522 RepID=UPI001E441716|nr:phage tail protein [Brevibacillus humidisoli]UFJ38946.1 phage tail protein [Brevibacillus humidisoli]
MNDQSRFFTCNKPSDWHKGTSENLQVTERGLLLQQVEEWAADRILSLGTLFGEEHTAVSDLAVARGERFVILDEQANVKIYDYRNEHVDVLFLSGHGLFTPQAQIVCHEPILYLADPLGERKLAAYALANGQALWTLSEWNGFPFCPLALTVDSGQNLYAVVPLDGGGVGDRPVLPAGVSLGVVKVNRAGQVIAVYRNDLLRLDRPHSVHSLRQRFHLTMAASRLCLFDSDRKTLYTLLPDQGLQPFCTLLDPLPYAGFVADTEGYLYFGSGRDRKPWEEDTRFLVKLSQDGHSTEKVSAYRGHADKLLLGESNRLYLFDRERNCLTILQLKPRSMDWPVTGQAEGVYLSASFDSTQAETIWHRLTLTADIPGDTQIRVSYIAADHKHVTAADRTIPDLDQLIRDPDTPFAEKLRLLDPLWSTPLINPRDALFFEAKGRYLWLKIELMGSKYHTPQLQKLHVYFPRTSYLSYLPGVYQENEASRDFLERFFALFGGFLEGMDEQIEHVSRYFDVDTVPSDFLAWLAAWLGIVVDDRWPKQQVRELIRQAPELYRLRGTRYGIERIIELYLGEKPLIVEPFQLKRMRQMMPVAPLVKQLYGDDPYTFSVLVRQERLGSEKERMIVQRLLEEQKPAFTEAKLVVLQPWMYLDQHTYLGINTYLSEPSLMLLDNKSVIPSDTLLTDLDRDNRIGIHTRLQLDSQLE